jgi:hypothetical protein
MCPKGEKKRTHKPSNQEKNECHLTRVSSLERPPESLEWINKKYV